MSTHELLWTHNCWCNYNLYGCVSLLAPECVGSLYVCVCVCVCVCLTSNQSTSKKPHYVSDLSKLIVCRPLPLIVLGGGVEPSTKFSKFERGGEGGGLTGSQFFRGLGALCQLRSIFEHIVSFVPGLVLGKVHMDLTHLLSFYINVYYCCSTGTFKCSKTVLSFYQDFLAAPVYFSCK